MTKILVFDNYDSFTYNLVHMAQKITGLQVDVFRNDAITFEKMGTYDKIIFSPGPGVPSEAGNMCEAIKHFAATKSILGVCLGHQAIAEAFGGSLTNLDTVFHGVATPIQQTATDTLLFKNLPSTFVVGRYHSWIVNEADLPQELQITAKDDAGYIMALQHKSFDVSGVQFHPESVLTPDGEQILINWFSK